MLYLKYFGGIFFDSNNDNDICQIVYSVILFITAIIMAIMSPYVVFEFDDWSEAFSMSMSLIICTTVNIPSCISTWYTRILYYQEWSLYTTSSLNIKSIRRHWRDSRFTYQRTPSPWNTSSIFLYPWFSFVCVLPFP